MSIWFLHRNKHYVDDDDENIRKKTKKTKQPTDLKHLTKTKRKQIPHFLTFKNNAKKQKPNMNSNNHEKFNRPFTPVEL